jgi:peptide/nickel transport system substrate-binding protein
MIIAGGCTGGSSPRATTTTPTTAALPTITQGGAITVAAEGEPGCMDWISTCAGSTWGVWTMETNTMPRAYDFTATGQYEPSILLTGEATVRDTPAQVVTYHLNPRAVWSDGQPITSQDFQYTWDQIAHGQGIADASGYDDIATVDDSNPLAAVVTFSQPYADWRKLFGGPYGLLPSHILEGQDRDALMKDGYSWSGGPWELAPNGWVRGQSITLMPNPDYWGKKPDLASVTFKLFADPAAELQAYQSGQVVAVYPAPQPSTAAYRNLPDTLFSTPAGLDFEALWFNVSHPPLDEKPLRQAIAYALDRPTVAGQLLGSLASGSVLQGFLTPAVADYSNQTFAKYSVDQAMVAQLMHAAGWTKDASGIWAMGTHQATLDLKVATSDPGGQQAAPVISAELRTAGFAVTLDAPEAPGTLFTQDLPAGAFTMALYPVDLRRELPSGAAPTVSSPQIVDNDPDQCALFCSSSIPTAATAASASPAYNYSRLSDPTLDRYLGDLGGNSDTNDRLNDAAQAALLLAGDVPAIPLATLPDVLVVDTAKVGVEGGVFNHNLAYGGYSYLNEWYLK